MIGMKQILMVEDDKRLGPTVKRGLEELGFAVHLARDASGMWATLAADPPPDLFILDLGLPDADGLDLLPALRDRGFQQPILLLTARDGLKDLVLGLDSGADDYLSKPFSFAELAARIRALARRMGPPGLLLRIGELDIDLATRRVLLEGEIVDVSPREFDFLVYLGRRAGQVVSRELLAKEVWNAPNRFTPLDNVIDVHVSRLRRKITTRSGWCPLRVIRGSGIQLGDAL